MGLPIYRDPDDSSVEENFAKVERTAATRRSTIRRESSVRPRRYAHPSPPAVRELAELIPDRSQPHPSPFVDANDEIQHLEAELERLRRHRILTHTRRGANRGLTTVAPEDVAVYARNPTGDLPSHLPRESALRFELGPRAPRSGATSPRRPTISRDSWVNRRTLPSPPHSIESSGRVRTPQGGRVMITDGPEDVDAGYTRDFAPSRGPYAGTPQPSEGMNRVVTEHNFDDPQNARVFMETPAETPSPETWESSYPPLRRVGHLSPRPRSSYDGLGDRRRSISTGSPASAESIVNEDRWETLLTTIDNDDLQPSHETSFDSTRSNSEPDSNRSTQTTATSFGEIGSLDDTCDLDLPQGITEEVVREIRERHRPARSEMRPSANEISRRSEHRNNRPGTGAGMVMFQNLLNRLSQRQDLSEEWWAAAGLARTIRENA